MDDAIRQHGTKSWTRIALIVKSKTRKQCRSKFQKERDLKLRFQDSYIPGPAYGENYYNQYSAQNQNTRL